MRLSSISRIVIHALLFLYALILGYILLGLILKFYINADIFFDLSFRSTLLHTGSVFVRARNKEGAGLFDHNISDRISCRGTGHEHWLSIRKVLLHGFSWPKVFGVPEVVPFVWFVIAYLTFSIARNAFKQQEHSRKDLLWLAIFAAFGSVAWDFLIDPMFSSYGYWVWTGQFLPLPELNGIPLTNFVGWFVLVTLMLSVYFATIQEQEKRCAKTQHT